MAKSFRQKAEEHQINLMSLGIEELFGHANGGGIKNGKPYAHILAYGYEPYNLMPMMQGDVKDYFRGNNISYNGGRIIQPNTLSSQVNCLNHLFRIRDSKKATRDVMQKLVGDKIQIKEMQLVTSKKEVFNQKFIAFEMVSNEDRMNEEKLTRGNTCTSIDALAIALDNNNKKHILVIEWKFVENDFGNKAPTIDTSKNMKEINRGKTRVNRYAKLIRSCKSLDSSFIKGDNDFYNSDFFTLPFYELMRQTLWATQNMIDFQADDYLHILVIPKDNPMVSKTYRCNGIKGIEAGWRKHLTAEGNDRFIVASPKDIVDVIHEKYEDDFHNLTDYLYERYYNF